MGKYQRIEQRRNAQASEVPTSDPITAALASVVRDVIREELACLSSNSDDRPCLVDRAQIARELSTSVATVDRMCREGMPYVRLGDVRRFDIVAVLEWLRERTKAEVAA